VARRAVLVAQGAAVGLVVLLFALLVWKLTSNRGGALAAEATQGKQPRAPDFTLPRLDRSGDLTLSSLRGKAVLVNMWASWCIPCKDEAPVLEKTWLDNRRRGLVVVGLDAKDFRSDARSFMRKFDLTYPVVYDGPGTTLGHYGVTGFPETYVVDRQGRIVDAFIGAIDTATDRARLRAAVERALQT
jgi:cytochrome c biogenesis protein CcmG/thiol:disulfide interchange protein DsbE